GRYCLGTPPIRLPEPAATTMAPTSRGKRPHQLADVIEADQRDAGDLEPAPRRAEDAAEAEAGGLLHPPLRATGGPDLAPEADLTEEDHVGRRGAIVEARHQRGSD